MGFQTCYVKSHFVKESQIWLEIPNIWRQTKIGEKTTCRRSFRNYPLKSKVMNDDTDNLAHGLNDIFPGPQVIRERGGEESSTEYVAALLTTLEAADTAESRRAAATLLAAAVRTAPEDVLQAKFGELAAPLLALLPAQQGGGDADPALARALIGCLSVALRAQVTNLRPNYAVVFKRVRAQILVVT